MIHFVMPSSDRLDSISEPIRFVVVTSPFPYSQSCFGIQSHRAIRATAHQRRYPPAAVFTATSRDDGRIVANVQRQHALLALFPMRSPFMGIRRALEIPDFDGEVIARCDDIAR